MKYRTTLQRLTLEAEFFYAPKNHFSPNSSTRNKRGKNICPSRRQRVPDLGRRGFLEEIAVMPCFSHYLSSLRSNILMPLVSFGAVSADFWRVAALAAGPGIDIA